MVMVEYFVLAPDRYFTDGTDIGSLIHPFCFVWVHPLLLPPVSSEACTVNRIVVPCVVADVLLMIGTPFSTIGLEPGSVFRGPLSHVLCVVVCHLTHSFMRRSSKYRVGPS
jgi:hypothetical protein